MGFATAPGDALGLQGNGAQIIRQTPATQHRIQPAGECLVLSGNAGGIATGRIIIEITRAAAEFPVFLIRFRTLKSATKMEWSVEK